MKLPAAIALLYGLCVIGNGMVRYFSEPDGETGLWFGVVMGAFAVLAALFFALRKSAIGNALIGFAILVVGGWFVYEAFVEKGIQSAEPRMLIIVALSFAASLYFLIINMPRSTPPSSTDS